MEVEPTNAPAKPVERKENLWANLLLNIILPTLILTKGSGEDALGPTWGILVALAFPIGYGLYDFSQSKKVNFFSALGVISVCLTGGISLLKLAPEYIAIKEAAIPGIIGLVCLGSTYTRYPLVRTFLYSDKIMQVDKVQAALEQAGNASAFEKSLKYASYMLAGSFFLSSALNYLLAKIVVVSSPGTEQYNSELGKMIAWSFPVITVPSMIVLLFTAYYLYRTITRLTHLTLDDILIQPNPKP